MRLQPDREYLVVWVAQTDADPEISRVLGSELPQWVEERTLTRHDYAVIDGTLIKDFPSE